MCQLLYFQIELANFELFSSCPKEFAVYSSDNFPTRDWVLLGIFNAAEQRVLQSFELKQEGFGKFIKVSVFVLNAWHKYYLKVFLFIYEITCQVKQNGASLALLHNFLCVENLLILFL